MTRRVCKAPIYAAEQHIAASTRPPPPPPLPPQHVIQTQDSASAGSLQGVQEDQFSIWEPDSAKSGRAWLEPEHRYLEPELRPREPDWEPGEHP